MKRYLLGLLFFCAMIPQVQAEDFWHDSVRACVVGGGVVGASSALLLYSAAAATATAAAAAATAGTAATAMGALPSSTVVLGNTIFGCGLGTIGTMFIYSIGTLYQSMVSQQQSALSPPQHKMTEQQPQE